MKSPSFESKSFPPRLAAATIVVLSACALLCASARAATTLVVRYPSEGADVAAVPASYSFGAAPPGAVVTVNGHAAWIAPDGGWSAFVPLRPGRFVLHVVSRLDGTTQEVDRSITVDSGAVASFPAAQTIVQRDEPLLLTVTATSGAQVTASGPGLTGVALAPYPALGPDAFSARVRASSHAAAPGHIVYKIVGTDGSVVETVSHGTLAVAASPVLYAAQVIGYAPDPLSGERPYAMLGTTADAPTDFMLPVGTQVDVTGRFGGRVRVALPGKPPEFLDAHQVQPVPGLNALPPALLTSMHKTEDARNTTYRLTFAGCRPAFRVRELTGATGSIRVFGVGSRSRFVDYPFALPQRAFWGYRTSWFGSTLIVSFRKPPAFAASPHRAVDGLSIVIDPGHSPDSGAVGPLGTMERDVNLDIGLRLASRLRAMGARVTMTRTSNAPVLLYARPALAERIGADVLVSVHNNANPDGVDPSTSHGFEIYAFQPHSRALAEAIHQAYRRETGIHDNGLHTGDFTLVREPAMPAVLTESAYITWPWEEMQLREPAFRERLAGAMADGMERWAEQMRTLETSGV